MPKRTVFISYTATSSRERIFFNITKELQEGERLTHKWLEEKELEIATTHTRAKILSWHILENEDGENKPTLASLGIMPFEDIPIGGRFIVLSSLKNAFSTASLLSITELKDSSHSSRPLNQLKPSEDFGFGLLPTMPCILLN